MICTDVFPPQRTIMKIASFSHNNSSDERKVQKVQSKKYNLT